MKPILQRVCGPDRYQETRNPPPLFFFDQKKKITCPGKTANSWSWPSLGPWRIFWPLPWMVPLDRVCSPSGSSRYCIKVNCCLVNKQRIQLIFGQHIHWSKHKDKSTPRPSGAWHMTYYLRLHVVLHVDLVSLLVESGFGEEVRNDDVAACSRHGSVGGFVVAAFRRRIPTERGVIHLCRLRRHLCADRSTVELLGVSWLHCWFAVATRHTQPVGQTNCWPVFHWTANVACPSRDFVERIPVPRKQFGSLLTEASVKTFRSALGNTVTKHMTKKLRNNEHALTLPV